MNRRDVSVIVVDDDLAVLSVTFQLLEKAGFTVYSADNAIDALEVIRKNPEIDLLLTDVRMARIDGVRLADMVRYLDPRVHILYMTAYDTALEFAPTLSHGPTLLKPFRQDELIAAIEDRVAADAGPVMHYTYPIPLRPQRVDPGTPK